MTALATVNPFYAARFHRVARAAPPQSQSRPEPERSVYAKLPRAPGTAAPCRT